MTLLSVSSRLASSNEKNYVERVGLVIVKD